ncbi:MAG: hypothetical protein IJE91_02215 [Clostridia bacterium]|nr:hypothetical protein [Clostridia bacterium]
MKVVNPFKEKSVKIEKTYESWKKLAATPYNPKTTSPFTKVRIILMNGTEFEANWFSHQFHRHCNNNDLRRELSVIRRREQQQQKKIASLKPIEETILQHTIGYEQLAVELTAILAQHVKDKYVKKALDFALLEDFDHLFRFANLMEMDEGIKAENLVGDYTEIMPGRPTIAEHRYPADDVKRFICNQTSDLFTKLTVNIITAAEQQTMNFYMNQANFYKNELGRKLFTEIAMIEEQHVSQYGSLIDTNCTWLENWLMHEYVECYLYYSCWEDESDEYVKEIWRNFYYEECGHLQKVAALLEQHEGKTWIDVFPCGGDFPEPLRFGENKEYIRKVIKQTGCNTADLEEYAKVSSMPEDAPFFKYNHSVNKPEADVASHAVIEKHIKKFGTDYRHEDSPNPIPALRNRKSDNTDFAR